MKIGNIEVKKLYLGALELEKVYAGIHLAYTKSHPVPVEYDGLTFTAEQANSTVKYNKSSVSTAEYSTNGTTWVNANGVTITLANIGDKVYFRGIISGNQSTSNYATFTLTGLVAASGSIMSMYNNNPDDTTISRNYAFYRMFKNNTNITTPPELPATTLSTHCYREMFYGCTSLLYSPELPALSVPERAYNDMFTQCTSLETVNTISCTSVSGQYSMAGMFSECRSLINVPEKLFIQTLSYASLQGMFAKCSLLEIAPELPATTLYQACYIGIFESCSNLKYIKCLATDISANICTRDWVSGVAATGTFVCPSTTSWTTGTSGIPSGWTRVAPPDNINYCSFTNNGNEGTVIWDDEGGFDMEYSFDKQTWTQCESGENRILIPHNGTVYFRGNNPNGFGENAYFMFEDGLFYGGGSIMTLLDKTDTLRTLSRVEFGYLFGDTEYLVKSPDLTATTLSGSCYENMFNGCADLESVTIYVNNVESQDCFAQWLDNVSNGGTVYQNGIYNIDSVLPETWVAYYSNN